MKKLSIPCDFRGEIVRFPIYVGTPRDNKHPLQHQCSWLSSERGGAIPQEVMDSFERLHTIAKEGNYIFEDLVVFALQNAQQDEEAPSFDIAQFQEKVVSLADAKSILLPKRQEASGEYKRLPVKTKHPYQNLAIGQSDLERYRHFQRLSQALMLEADVTSSRASTAFFAVLGFLYHRSEDEHVDLPMAYDIFASDDLQYSLIVVLDTIGQFLPRFIFDLILAISQDNKHTTAIAAEICERLIAFCLAEQLSGKNLQLVRLHKDLRKHLDIHVPGEK